MPAGAPSADQISRILSLYTPRELAELLGPLWQERLRGIAADELAALGISPEWHVINPLINTHLQEFGLDRLKIPIATSRAAAAEAIQAGISAGEGIGPIARRLVTLGATDSGYRARLIARTEVVRSANMGRQISWKASGLPGLRKRWLSALSSTTRDSHRALHNKTVPLDGRFEFDASLSPGVPGSASVPGDATHVAHAANCILPGQVVEGGFLGGIRSEYVGRVVTIQTSKRHELTLTCNHPVLTRRGWVPAGSLNESDSVVSYLGPARGTVSQEQVEQEPSLVEQVFSALAELGTSNWIRLSPVDLHGDAKFVKGDVEVVSIQRELLRRIEARVFEHLNRLGFVSSYRPGLGFSSFEHFSLSSLFTADGLPRFPANAFDFRSIVSDLIPAEIGGISLRAQQTALLKPFGNDSTAITKFVGQLNQGGSGVISFDNIVNLRHWDYSGHVYDLQTVGGWMVAENMVISNCKCTSTAFDPEHGKAIEFGGPEHVAIAKARDADAISWEQEAVPLIVKYYNNITDETLRILGVDRADLE